MKHDMSKITNTFIKAEDKKGKSIEESIKVKENPIDRMKMG